MMQNLGGLEFLLAKGCLRVVCDIFMHVRLYGVQLESQLSS